MLPPQLQLRVVLSPDIGHFEHPDDHGRRDAAADDQGPQSRRERRGEANHLIPELRIDLLKVYNQPRRSVPLADRVRE